MDVLDHSCSKLGFGGKMCIDGTFKFEEEKDEDFRFQNADFTIDLNVIISEKFSEVKHVNASLLKKEIPVLIVSVEKNKKGHIRELHQQIFELQEIEGVKMILYVEHTVDANDLTVALWRFCNNLDPKRDNILLQRPSTIEQEKIFACMGFDGTRKTKELDNFGRDWPNIIVADEATIKSVDEKWNQLGLGDFIPSPSLKFRDQLYGEEAVVS
jgi:4-hydroxy-3-polyprenylbenzoate decarboxylase